MKHKREIIFFRNIPNGCAQMKTAKTFNTIYTIYDLSKLITRKFHSTRYTVRQEWRLMSAFSSNFASLLRSIWRNRGEKRKNKKGKKWNTGREREERGEEQREEGTSYSGGGRRGTLFSGRWSNEYGQLDESLKSEVASSSFTCVQQQTAWLPLEKLISAPRCALSLLGPAQR